MSRVALLVLCVSLPIVSFGQTVATSEPTATIHTTEGDLHCKLLPRIAPLGVENFVGLAKGTRSWTSPVSHERKIGVPLYDGTIFHRVIPEFMIQGGDPAGNGSGDPGYAFKDETSPDVKFDRPGRLAYANSGPNTNGSQFFITEDSVHSSHLSGKETIFGQCDAAAVELVKHIARMPSDPSNGRPFHPVKITNIDICLSGCQGIVGPLDVPSLEEEPRLKEASRLKTGQVKVSPLEIGSSYQITLGLSTLTCNANGTDEMNCESVGPTPEVKGLRGAIVTQGGHRYLVGCMKTDDTCLRPEYGLHPIEVEGKTVQFLDYRIVTSDSRTGRKVGTPRPPFFTLLNDL